MLFQSVFRSSIVAEGVVLEMANRPQYIVNEFTGIPYKVFKNTDFIKGMANFAIELTKFNDVRTVSGTRGQMKYILNHKRELSELHLKIVYTCK